MSLNLNSLVKSNQLLDGFTTKIKEIGERTVNAQFHNDEDVKLYPHFVVFAVIDTPADKDDSLGDTFTVKLKDISNLKQGQKIQFGAKKSQIRNEVSHLWSNSRGFVQLSIKGDEISDE